jgi:hypothetical protein
MHGLRSLRSGQASSFLNNWLHSQLHYTIHPLLRSGQASLWVSILVCCCRYTGRPVKRASTPADGTVESAMNNWGSACCGRYTGDPSYEQKSLKAFRIIQGNDKPNHGLMPLYIDVNSGRVCPLANRPDDSASSVCVCVCARACICASTSTSALYAPSQTSSLSLHHRGLPLFIGEAVYSPCPIIYVRDQSSVRAASVPGQSSAGSAIWSVICFRDQSLGVSTGPALVISTGHQYRVSHLIINHQSSQNHPSVDSTRRQHQQC